MSTVAELQMDAGGTRQLNQPGASSQAAASQPASSQPARQWCRKAPAEGPVLCCRAYLRNARVKRAA